jgi:hypothetical protein
MKRSKPGSKRSKKAFAVSIQAEARDFAEVVNLIPLGNALLPPSTLR